MENVQNLINIGPTDPIQILNQHEIFWRFCMCNSNDTFDKNKKILKWVLGLNSNDRKSTKDKANISNPKVNRGCAPLTANHTSADCVQISLGPSIPYIPLGVYHTGRFNAMPSKNSNQQIPPVVSRSLQNRSTKLPCARHVPSQKAILLQRECRHASDPQALTAFLNAYDVVFLSHYIFAVIPMPSRIKLDPE